MEELKYSIDKSADEENIYIYMKNEIKPVWYQIEMIGSNPDIRLIPPIYMQKDNENVFCYQTDNKMSLKEFLINHEIRSRDICRIIRDIAANMIAGREYLLNDSGYLFNEELIFFYNGMEDIRNLYVPVNAVVSSPNKLQELILRIITTYAVIIPGEEYFLTHILNLVKKEMLDFDTIFDFCDSLLRRNAEVQTSLDMLSHENDIYDEEIKAKDNHRIIIQLIPLVLFLVIIFTPVGSYIDFYGIGKNLLLGILVIVEIAVFLSKRSKIE